jgi:hypothetical protein
MQANAQVKDTVSVSAGYANQNYYQLSTGAEATAPKNEWDIAFQTNGSMGYAISINSYSGVSLYTYPNAAASATNWAATFDTAGLSTWPKMYNSETTWSWGAFNQNADGANQFDLGWGVYDMTTHFVTGDSMFVVKLTNGDFKKLWVKNLANGTYNFVYANLNGTGEQTVALAKSAYATKNFGYYSLVNNAAVDHEPVANTNWDLVFTQYTGDLGGGYISTATGILANNGVLTAKAENVADVDNYDDYQTQTYMPEINVIGWNWKTYDMGSGTYTINDSTVFFVQAKDSAIWKVVLTGFGGSADGNFIFSKEKLKSAPVTPPPPTGINEVNNVATLSLYPNPIAKGTDLNVVINLMQINSTVNLTMYDITGKQVFKTKVNNQTGLKALAVPTSGLRSGMYVVALEVNGNTAVQKVSIQ